MVGRSKIIFSCVAACLTAFSTNAVSVNAESVSKFLSVPVQGWGPAAAAVCAGMVTSGITGSLVYQNPDLTAAMPLGILTSVPTLILLKYVPNNIYAKSVALIVMPLIWACTGPDVLDKVKMGAISLCSSLATLGALNYFNAAA